jgi:hypothetical protein
MALPGDFCDARAGDRAFHRGDTAGRRRVQGVQRHGTAAGPAAGRGGRRLTPQPPRARGIPPGHHPARGEHARYQEHANRASEPSRGFLRRCAGRPPLAQAGVVRGPDMRPGWAKTSTKAYSACHADWPARCCVAEAGRGARALRSLQACEAQRDTAGHRLPPLHARRMGYRPFPLPASPSRAVRGI